MDELLIAVNPDPDSRLPYLMRLPLGTGMVFRTSGTWPRTKALYCYPVSLDGWPADPQIVERQPVRSCVRRGVAIDLVLARASQNRSQLVFTTARGRDAVFRQSPRTRKQARPNVTTPTARAAGIAELEIVVDTREQYPYRFTGQQVATVKRALPCGDYGIALDGRLVAAVGRKSLPDLVSSLIDATLRYALGELAALPCAAVVVEEPLLAGLQARPHPPSGRGRRTRRAAGPLAEHADRVLRDPATGPGMDLPLPRRRPRMGRNRGRHRRPHRPTHRRDRDLGPTTSRSRPERKQVRAWARAAGLTIADRGRLRPELWQAWRDAHTS